MLQLEGKQEYVVQGEMERCGDCELQRDSASGESEAHSDGS